MGGKEVAGRGGGGQIRGGKERKEGMRGGDERKRTSKGNLDGRGEEEEGREEEGEGVSHLAEGRLAGSFCRQSATKSLKAAENSEPSSTGGGFLGIRKITWSNEQEEKWDGVRKGRGEVKRGKKRKEDREKRGTEVI